MQTHQLEKLLNEAHSLIAKAKTELNRSKEDVVPHLICTNTRKAIANFLSAYLMRSENPVPETADLEVLREACEALDPKFSELNLGAIDCRFDLGDHEFCANISKVKECFELAKQTSNLVDFKTWPLSVPVK